MAKATKPTTQSTAAGMRPAPNPSKMMAFAPAIQRQVTATPPVVAPTKVKPLQSSGYTQRVFSPAPVKPTVKPQQSISTQRTYSAAPAEDKILSKLAASTGLPQSKTLKKTLGDTGLTEGQVGDAARYTAQAISLGQFPNLMSPTIANAMGLTEAERVSLGYNPNWPYNRVDPSNGPGLPDNGGGGGGRGRSGGGSGFGGALSRGEAFFTGSYNWRIGP